ncbi:hypothetical protein GCM10010317_045630 [Streptomyces mirabilis]|nr:hypothetical protein GCM10010317_045630 [Streptomyces mirabilis]
MHHRALTGRFRRLTPFRWATAGPSLGRPRPIGGGQRRPMTTSVKGRTRALTSKHQLPKIPDKTQGKKK